MTDAVDVPTLAKQMMEAAKRATPGEWSWDAGVVPPDGPGRYADIYADGGEVIIAHFNDLTPEGMDNATFMTLASPSNITTLCEAYIALKAERPRGESCDCACLKDALTRAEKAEAAWNAMQEIINLARKHGGEPLVIRCVDAESRAATAEAALKGAEEALEEIERYAPATQEICSASLMADIARQALQTLRQTKEEKESGPLDAESEATLHGRRQQASEVAGWRDISSAPKDGTKVDLWLCPTPKPWGATEPYRLTDAWFSAGKWWVYENNDEQRTEVSPDYIRFWMPPPDPPKPSSLWQIGVLSITGPDVAWTQDFVRASDAIEASDLAGDLGYYRNVRVREVAREPSGEHLSPRQVEVPRSRDEQPNPTPEPK